MADLGAFWSLQAATVSGPPTLSLGPVLSQPPGRAVGAFLAVGHLSSFLVTFHFDFFFEEVSEARLPHVKVRKKKKKDSLKKIKVKRQEVKWLYTIRLERMGFF